VISPRLPHVFYGGDYNPEQWPEEVWEEDARLMGEAGVNLVSLGVFAWARLEPRPGSYDFGWLDGVMDLLHEHGVFVNLATATASPPPWLARLHPESLPVTEEGVTLWPGSRQQYCPSSPAYREAAARLVEQIATRYRDHPALLMWHVNNEYGCHASTCYCDRSAEAFRQWLQKRYGSLETLNEAWCTAFWSQRYDDWEEINPPRLAPYSRNPGQQLDFRRFTSDEVLALFTMERDILKRVTPDVPVTTNFMGFFKPLDYWSWAAEEDVVSHDSYPDPADPDAPVAAAMSYDLMRSLGRGRPWILMEQATSHVTWRRHNVVKPPGLMRLWSYQALARGADGIMFFQWRASPAGAEKFHSAMVPHAGTTSRVWREVVGLGEELAGLDAVIGTVVESQVAIVFDWENWWALEDSSQPWANVRLMERVTSFYEPLFRGNLGVDFVGPGSDLSGYRLIVAPALYLTQGDLATRLGGFAEKGGTVVASFLSGVVDEGDHVFPGGYPGPLRGLLGLRVEEFVPYPEEASNTFLYSKKGYGCDLWSDVIELQGAQALGVYEGDFYAGRPAITRHEVGSGRAYYVGTRPERDFMVRFLADLCEEVAIGPVTQADGSVEAVRRQGPGGSFLFLLNHGTEEARVPVERGAVDLLTGNRSGSLVRLEPFGVAILRN
jgi:beta-galactosidase